MGRLARLLIERSRQQSSEWNANQVATISPSPMDLIIQVAQDFLLSSSDLVIDLGCGDARWLTYLAKQFSCQCWGIEIDEMRLKLAKENVQQDNLSPLIEFIRSDLFHIDLGKYSLIVVYLSRDGNEKLKSKLLAECDQRAIILAVGFSMRGWVPQRTYSHNGLSAYCYNRGLQT